MYICFIHRSADPISRSRRCIQKSDELFRWMRYSSRLSRLFSSLFPPFSFSVKCVYKNWVIIVIPFMNFDSISMDVRNSFFLSLFFLRYYNRGVFPSFWWNKRVTMWRCDWRREKFDPKVGAQFFLLVYRFCCVIFLSNRKTPFY